MSSRMNSKRQSGLGESQSQVFYEFFINDNEKNQEKKLKTNYISTTKYNFLTFLPKSFLLQFSRLPNVYFLFIAIIQSIPIISPLTSVTAILPLIFVLCVSMTRELLEDISRYKYDKQSNSRQVIVLRNNQFESDKSSSIRPGEIILVNNNEEFPCDIILLDTSNKDGVCYIETGSLDGEKNLKNKTCNKDLKGVFYQYEKLTDNYQGISGNCTCDMPNPELYRFDGKVNLIINGNSNDYSLTSSQLLLKGALLKQTGQIIGIAVYTGHNNKILLNSKNPKMKYSKIERLMNYLLVFIFVFQICLCIICAVIHKHFEKSKVQFIKLFIFQGDDLNKDINESFLSFFTYLLLLNTMIPISLIVTLEIVKVIQGFFIGFDCEMYSQVRKKFCGANSVSIIEELGKVDYIFSDKTGTLTCNKMVFKYCAIGDQCYEYVRGGEGEENIHTNNNAIQNSSKQMMKFKFDSSKQKDPINIYSNNFNQGGGLSHYSPNQLRFQNNISQDGSKSFTPFNNGDITDKSRISLLRQRETTQGKVEPIKIGNNYFNDMLCNVSSPIKGGIREIIKEFWLALAIGNECMATDSERIDYTGLSPDDIELVKAAAWQGFRMLKSTNEEKRVKIGDEIKKYPILNLIGFTSDRKRMSIIVRDDNKIKLYTKGADSEIKKRMSKEYNQKYLDNISLCTDYYSTKGYRTLFVGMRIIPEADYEKWAEKLKSSELDLENKNKLVQQCYNEIETNIQLLGCTIVEDKLQDQVPETIRDLRNAGIKIWMLTGDKIDTAENISLSCNLVSRTQKSFKISPLSRKRTKTFKRENPSDNGIPELSMFFNEYYIFADAEIGAGENAQYSILIESSILGKIFKDESVCTEFLQIALKAQSVVCCRVSPLQKAQVVTKVKELNPEYVTLAVGDGGNDVSMIMEANVGVGIYGEEGMLAVQSSDFSIGEFKLLRRLLFFHGRNSLNRTGNMILYFFYKNFVFTILQFYYCYYNIASGQSLIDDWFITLFNLLFTALPLGIQALTNFDTLEEDSKLSEELIPILYCESNRRGVFTILSFFLVILKGVFFSVINYYGVISPVSESMINKKGYLGDIWYNSLAMYSNIIFLVSFSLAIRQRYITWIFPFTLLVTSWILYVLFCVYCSKQIYFNSSGSIEVTFTSVKFYLSFILVVGTCFIFDKAIDSSEILLSNEVWSELLTLRKNQKKKISNKLQRILKYFKMTKAENEVEEEPVTNLERKLGEKSDIFYVGTDDRKDEPTSLMKLKTKDNINNNPRRSQTTKNSSGVPQVTVKNSQGLSKGFHTFNEKKGLQWSSIEMKKVSIHDEIDKNFVV